MNNSTTPNFRQVSSYPQPLIVISLFSLFLCAASCGQPSNPKSVHTIAIQKCDLLYSAPKEYSTKNVGIYRSASIQKSEYKYSMVITEFNAPTNGWLTNVVIGVYQIRGYCTGDVPDIREYPSGGSFDLVRLGACGQTVEFDPNIGGARMWKNGEQLHFDLEIKVTSVYDGFLGPISALLHKTENTNTFYDWVLSLDLNKTESMAETAFATLVFYEPTSLARLHRNTDTPQVCGSYVRGAQANKGAPAIIIGSKASGFSRFQVNNSGSGAMFTVEDVLQKNQYGDQMQATVVGLYADRVRPAVETVFIPR